jgi:hypothetical protein
VRCGFYVEDDVLEPWEEDWPTPPLCGAIMSRYGTTWVVRRTWLTESPEARIQEATVLLAPAPSQP